MKPFLHWINLWQTLSTLGAGQESSPLRKRIILTNKFSLTLSVIVIFYTIVWIINGNLLAIIFNLSCACLFLSILWMNYKGFTTLSRFLVLAITNIAMFLMVAGVGKIADTQVAFYVLPTFAFLLFEPKEKKGLITAIVTPMVLFGVLAFYDFKLYDFSVPGTFIASPILTYYIVFIVIILCMYYMYRDTERTERELRKTNDKLMSSQIFLESIIENVPLVFYTRGLDNRYTLVNSEFEKLFKVKQSEVLNKTDAEIFPKPTVDFLMLHDNEVIQSRSSKMFEAAIDHGNDKTFLYTKFPILGPDGVVFGVCGIAMDISERVEKQKVLDEQRALVLHNMKLSALGEMANGMSHEINNPLATITLILNQLIRFSSKPIATEVLQSSLFKIQKNVQRISDIVLALRKFIGDSGTLNFDSIDVIDLISETLELCQESFKQAGVRLEVKAYGTPFPVFGQSEALRQAIYNILINAFDAVENRENAWIELKTVYYDDHVKIIVSDSGPGVPDDLKDKIFQPFITTKDVGKGRGLGLSISRGIINSHNGSLYLDTKSKLTSFVIELPNKI